MEENKGNVIIYQSEDGVVRLDVRLEDKTVWLTIDQMAELFGKSRSTINEHILHIYEEGELEEDKTKRKIGISDFSTKPTNLYNLDVIISVGYRVNFPRYVQNSFSPVGSISPRHFGQVRMSHILKFSLPQFRHSLPTSLR